MVEQKYVASLIDNLIWKLREKGILTEVEHYEILNSTATELYRFADLPGFDKDTRLEYLEAAQFAQKLLMAVMNAK